MKRLIILFFIIFPVYLWANDVIEQKFDNTFLDIKDVSVQRLFEAQKDDSSMEDYYYQQDIWAQERELEKSIQSKRIPADEITGRWQLYDPRIKKFFPKNKSILLSGSIFFNDINGFCGYNELSATSYVYKIKENEYIVFPTWDAGIIRLLKFYGNKFYIYNLDGNEWCLDELHSSGAYFCKVNE